MRGTSWSSLVSVSTEAMPEEAVMTRGQPLSTTPPEEHQWPHRHQLGVDISNQKEERRVGEMALLVKYLLYNQDDLSSIPRTLVKARLSGTCIYNPSTGRQRQEKL